MLSKGSQGLRRVLANQTLAGWLEKQMSGGEEPALSSLWRRGESLPTSLQSRSPNTGEGELPAKEKVLENQESPSLERLAQLHPPLWAAKEG